MFSSPAVKYIKLIIH